jgi:GNAT superfamily N-acetyltransferase
VKDNTSMRQGTEVRRVRGDDPVARELVAAMEAWVTENFGPTTPDRTSTVAAEEMVPPGGAFVIVYEDGEAVGGGGLRRLGEDVAEIKRMFVAPSARGRGTGGASSTSSRRRRPSSAIAVCGSTRRSR